jgi:putative transposase
MDERLKFVARLLDGEKMAVLCREFGISRKTGYKLINRYNDSGLEGLTDRSRRPYRHANQLPFQIEKLIVRAKQDKPNWGAPKIRERLVRLYPDVHTPAISTVHAVLDRHGLVKRRKRRRNRATGTPLSHVAAPNELWCADYKGEFMLADRRYCYPLTISDFASRYLLACEALHTTKEAYAFTVFESVFKEFGLPAAIRTDNGVPFASPNALFNLSRLSVWWLRLGIAIERIKPGCPQQNGRHERMHLTLKLETTKPAGANFLQQQARFDDFVEEFNTERPHQALDMACPPSATAHRRDPIGDCRSLTTRSTTRPSPSPHAGASVSTARRSISASSLPARPSASNRSRIESGWLASWTMIWDTSMMRHADRNHSRTLSGRKCYLCLRYKM